MSTTTLTPGWFSLRYHRDQNRYWRSSTRFKAVVAGRRSGKTELARRKVIRWLPVRKPWPDPLYFYALPTFTQAARVAWPRLKMLVPKDWLAPNGIKESELSITTRFGSKLYVLGMDKPERAEGVGWDGGIVDESSDQKAGMFDRTLRPALSDRRGWCDRIGVPKRTGPGAQEFKEFWERGKEGDRKDPDIESFWWPSWDILPEDEIASARRLLDEKDFNEQYGASWETVGGKAYYGFDSVLSVSDEIAYNPDLVLLIGCDFNVDPMAWVICQSSDGKLRVLDEIYDHATNTEATLIKLAKRYGEHKSGCIFFGDASGRARDTSASQSDYIQIRNFKGITDSRVMFPESNPAVHDRIASVNAMLKNAEGERRCKIHPRCRNLIRDLMEVGYKEGTNEIDKSNITLTHISDALGYLIHWMFPLIITPSKEPIIIPAAAVDPTALTVYDPSRTEASGFTVREV